MYRDAFPILTVQDIERSLGFYRDLLGFEQTYRFPSDGPPVYVGLSLGGSQIGIGEAAADQANPHNNGMFELCIYTDNCDAAVAGLRERGVTVVEEPADQPWGERMARVADPDGFRVMVLSTL